MDATATETLLRQSDEQLLLLLADELPEKFAFSPSQSEKMALARDWLSALIRRYKPTICADARIRAASSGHHDEVHLVVLVSEILLPHHLTVNVTLCGALIVRYGLRKICADCW